MKYLLLIMLLLGTIVLSGCEDSSSCLTCRGTWEQDIDRAIAPLTEEVGVFAFLTAENTTTLTTANQFYLIDGIFNNSISEHFNYNSTLNAIVYENSRNRTLVVHWSISAKSSKAGSTVSVATGQNGFIRECGAMPVFFKFAGEYMTWSGFCVSEYAPDDYVQLYIKSDLANTDVIVQKMTTYITHFFN